MPQTLLELLRSFKNRDTIRAWLADLFTIVQDPQIYYSYFRQERNKLLTCKVLINLAIPKQRIKEAEIETFDLRSFVIDNSLKDILTDYGFCLNGSRIGLSKHPGGNGASIAITPFNVHLAQSKRECRWANQVDEADEEKNFRLLAWVQLDRIFSTTVCGPGMVNGRLSIMIISGRIISCGTC